MSVLENKIEPIEKIIAPNKRTFTPPNLSVKIPHNKVLKA